MAYLKSERLFMTGSPIILETWPTHSRADLYIHKKVTVSQDCGAKSCTEKNVLMIVVGSRGSRFKYCTSTLFAQKITKMKVKFILNVTIAMFHWALHTDNSLNFTYSLWLMNPLSNGWNITTHPLFFIIKMKSFIFLTNLRNVMVRVDQQALIRILHMDFHSS